MGQEYDFYTYLLRRKCLYCNKEIPDQAHKTQKYCKREELPDGSIRSCRDDFNAILRRALYLPYKKIVEHHKQTDIEIIKLLDEHGEKVTTELINRSGINLKRPFEFEVDNKTGFYTFYFTRYAFKQTGESNFKIFKHGRLF